MLVSHNGGQTWTPAATCFKDDVREHFDLRSVHFVTPKLGYAVGGIGSRIMVTEDGGASWSYRPVPNRQWLRAVWADESGKIVAAGDGETVVVSNSRGFDWEISRGSGAKVDLLTLMASESYPMTLDLKSLSDAPLKGTNVSTLDWAEYVIRNFQSQGTYHARTGRLSLIQSRVPVPSEEKSIFDGLDQGSSGY